MNTNFKGIDHVGVIVANLSKARRLLEEGFGLECIREVHKTELTSAFFKGGNAVVELIEILDPAIRRRRLGEGRDANVEHIAIEVDHLDVLTLLARLDIKTTAPPEVSNTNVYVWTQAATSGGVVYQFLERARAAS